MKRLFLIVALLLLAAAPASACPFGGSSLRVFGNPGCGGGASFQVFSNGGGCGNGASFQVFNTGGFGPQRTFFRRGPFGGTVFRQRNF